MADKRKTPDEAGGAGPRKRAVPTIDLTAIEVPPPGAADEPAATPGESEAPLPNDTSNEHWNWLKANIKGPAIAGGVAGAAIMMLVLFGLWLTGLVPIRYAGSTAMRARVTALEMELQDFKSRPAGAVDTKSIDALSDRVVATENAMKSLGLALAALNSRSDDNSANTTLAGQRADAAEKAVAELRSSVQIASTASAGLSSADLDALQKRIAGLEQSTKSARDDIAKTTDTPARLALSAAALRDLAFSGAPLTAALAQAKSLGADEKFLAPLEPFAASGVPAQAALVQELRATLPAMLKVSGAPAPSGGLERLQANAGNLVRVRPVNSPPGDETSAVLARVEIEAAHGDIAAAFGDLGKLPDAQRAPAQAWIKKVNDRQAALAAARAFATDTAAALGPKP